MREPVRHAREVDLRLELVRQRYGERLGPEELDDLRRAVATIVEQVAALRAVPLTNADEPLPGFQPLRGDE
jgi:hypothetical protein